LRSSKRKLPDVPPPALDVVAPDLLAWAQVVDVSRLTDDTPRKAEWYLRKYRLLNWSERREVSLRLVSVVAAQVTPPPAVTISALDIMATVLRVRQRDLLGGGPPVQPPDFP
jgi:hypothetical protein